VRFLPLYLHLTAPTWPVHRVAYVYLLGWGLEVAALIAPVQALMQAGRMVKGVGILWFVWCLGVLTRGDLGWLGPASSRRPRASRRANASDHGFGAFKGLIVSAYLWLAVAAGGELMSGVMWWTGSGVGISHDAIRHLYLMGFVTLLILGVGVRMLPGLMHARGVANPGLVSVALWLGNASVIGRVVLIGLPGPIWQKVPLWAVQGARVAFAWSGMLGLAAVFCTTLNWWRTAKMASHEAASAPASAPE
jgi:hypothetical protein